MKLRTQFILAATILAVLLLALAGFVVGMQLRVDEIQKQQEIAIALERQANDLSYLSNNYLLYGEQAQLVQWEAAVATFSAEVDALKPVQPEPAALVGRMKANSQRLQAVFQDIVSAVESRSAGSGILHDPAFLQVSWSRIEVQNRQIIFDASRLERMLDQQIDRANFTSSIVVFALMGTFALALLVLYSLMYRRTIAGIAGLQAGAEIIGSGDLDHVIPENRRDELGDLSRAFNKMTSDLKGVTTSKADLENEVEERQRLLLREQELSEELAATNEELVVQNEEVARVSEINAQLYLAQKEVAELLQHSLMDLPDQLPGVEYSHAYRSATAEAFIGGDFYDVFEAAAGRIGLLVGDVCGHGVEAARTATRVKDTVHAFSHESHHPNDVLEKTNRLLIERHSPGLVTVFLGLLDPSTGRLEYSAAGHPGPLILDEDAGVERLGIPSFPLGLHSGSAYETRAADLGHGAVLILYTDGILEARRGVDFFGEDGLVQSVWRHRTAGLELLPAAIVGDVLGFSGGELKDDLALLALRLSSVVG